MVFMRVFVLEEQPSYKEHAELAFTSVCILGEKFSSVFGFLGERKFTGFQTVSL